MRLFVGLWPPPPVLEVLDALPRPEHPALRWTAPEQWHVTLRFLGQVEDPVVPEVAARLERALDGTAAAELVLGPEVAWLGRARRSPLVAPVAGADALAAAVAEAVPELPEAAPAAFRGHLTLARVRRGRVGPSGLAGLPIHASWVATAVAVVRSRLGHDGARYDTVAEIPLRPGPRGGG